MKAIERSLTYDVVLMRGKGIRARIDVEYGGYG